MAILDDVSAQMKDALRGQDKLRLGALRQIRAGLLNRMKEDGSDTVSDEDAQVVLRRLEKQRKESIEAFAAAGRDAQAETERAELAVIQSFLPGLADADQTRAWVLEAVSATGAAGPSDVGRVMGAVMKAHKGEVDGNLAREIAAEVLAAS